VPKFLATTIKTYQHQFAATTPEISSSGKVESHGDRAEVTLAFEKTLII
jgi:hypothetical protein